MKMFSIIACIDSKRGIGKNGTLPWSIKEDMDWFKKTTVGDGKNVVVMGRKTWESIPEKYRPLNGRHNIIISGSLDTTEHRYEYFDLFLDDLHVLAMLCESMGLEYSSNKKFVIGGAMLYNEAISYPECQELILTILEDDYECDVFFPEFENEWECVWSEPMKTVAGRFTKWKRK